MIQINTKLGCTKLMVVYNDLESINGLSPINTKLGSLQTNIYLKKIKVKIKFGFDFDSWF